MINIDSSRAFKISGAVIGFVQISKYRNKMFMFTERPSRNSMWFCIAKMSAQNKSAEIDRFNLTCLTIDCVVWCDMVLKFLSTRDQCHAHNTFHVRNINKNSWSSQSLKICCTCLNCNSILTENILSFEESRLPNNVEWNGGCSHQFKVVQQSNLQCHEI